MQGKGRRKRGWLTADDLGRATACATDGDEAILGRHHLSTKTGVDAQPDARGRRSGNVCVAVKACDRRWSGRGDEQRPVADVTGAHARMTGLSVRIRGGYTPLCCSEGSPLALRRSQRRFLCRMQSCGASGS